MTINDSFKGSPDDYYQLVSTDPAWLYNHCLLGGFQFDVNGDSLIVAPAHQIDDEMAVLIIQHKIALISLVKNNQCAGGEHDPR